MPVRVGTAGWALPKELRPAKRDERSRLADYAELFDLVEVNSTFYRLPRISTVERWAREVPASFRFSLKVPKVLSHAPGGAGDALERFLEVAGALGRSCGCLLLQTPPQQHRNERIEDLLFALREAAVAPVVFEPRHASWSSASGGSFLSHNGIARVAADPARAPSDAVPGGNTDLVYYRLHGSPRIYWSAYGEAGVKAWAHRIAEHPKRTRVYVVFDNTAGGSATQDALLMRKLLLGGV